MPTSLALRERLARLPAPARAALTLLAAVIGCELVFGWKSTAAGLPVGIPLGNLVEGAVGGLLYAMVGLGVVLVHRANRIINFAQAALGTTPALLGILLISETHVPYVLGLLATLLASVVFGVFAERVVLRAFMDKSRLILTVATIGLGQALVLGELLLPKAFGQNNIVIPAVKTPLDHFRVSITGVRLNGNYLAVVVVAALVLTVMSIFFSRTRIGLAVRASAENADRARLLGIPVSRVVTVVWVLAAVLSGLAAFLREPLVGSSIGTSIDLSVLLFGLAAAVLAGLDSLPTTVVAGVSLGMLDRSAYYGTNNSNLSISLLLPVLLAFLLLRRRSTGRAADSGIASFSLGGQPRRVPLELRRLPEVVWAGRTLTGLAVLGALLVPQVFGVVQLPNIITIVVTAIVGVSVVVLTGWAGQISLGQFGVAGVGAAVAGGLATHAHSDFFLTLVAAVVVGAVVSTLIGIPALRLPGLLLAVVTLAFAATVQNVLLDPKYFGWLLPASEDTVARPVLFGRWSVQDDTGYYYVCLAGLGLALLVARSVRRSRSGRVFISQRDNVRSSQSYGISALRTRLAAFAVAGGIAALGGALAAYNLGTVNGGDFTVDLSLLLFVSVVVGGASSPAGAIIGVLFYGVLKYDGTHLLGFLDHVGLQALAKDAASYGVATGVLFVLGFFPGGIASFGEQLRNAYLRRVAQARGLRVPSLFEDSLVPIELDAPAAEVVHEEPVDALLEVRGLSVSYDTVRVLFDVDVHVRRGEVLALLGTNGAGKSTLLKAITGLVPSTGTVVLDGQPLDRLDAPGRVGRGMVMVPGGRGIFPGLTVAEHFRAARWLVEQEAGDVRLQQVLAWFPRLTERWETLAGDMSGGEQQQLAVGMAFLADPQLLVIDELSLGLSPSIVERLLSVVREINARGTAVIIVEQSVNVALTIADRAYFLEKGEVRFSGPTAELLERDDVLRSVFFAGDGVVSTPAQRQELLTGAPALEVRDLAVSFGGVRAVAGVGLQVARGEVLGLIGQNGAGKTTIFDLVSGFLTPSSGQVLLAGTDVTSLAPDARARLGLGRSFQDARIFPSMTVAENIATALERHLPFHDHLASALCLPDVRLLERDVAWSVADLVELLNLGDYRDKKVSDLSTGSRRVCDIAMAMAFDPDVLLLDEPSSGIAQRETEALAPLLLRLRDETGTALLVIEHDMPLISAISDRMVALELGQVLVTGTPAEVLSDPAVLASYLGTDSATVNRSGPALAGAAS